MMKKIHSWVLAATLTSGLMFAGCTENDNPVKPENPVTPTETTDMPELKLDFESMADWYAAAVKKCHPLMKQVWGNVVDPADFNLLLVNDTKNKVYFIDQEGKREVPESEWTNELRGAVLQLDTYYFMQFNGKKCAMLNSDLSKYERFDQMLTAMGYQGWSDLDKICENLSLFYHESFHKYVQIYDLGWEDDNTAYNRDNVYPVLYEPRIYRKLAMLALKKAWEDPSQKAEQYACAKYWIQKYEVFYPEEAQGIKSTDINESTAEYFARTIVHRVIPEFKELYDIDTYNLASSVDVESYMSSIAISLLVRDGRQEEAVNALTKGKITPINLLLKDVSVPAGYDESKDDASKEIICKAMDAIYGPESQFFKPVAQLAALHKEGKAVYLVTGVGNGYTSAQGSFTMTDFPGLTCYNNFSTAGSDFEISGITIMDWKRHYFIPIQTADNLTLTDSETMAATPSDIYEITCDMKATLTAVNNVEGLTLNSLPIPVERGKDKLGNTYFICR